jgi:hypothetical protein
MPQSVPTASTPTPAPKKTTGDKNIVDSTLVLLVAVALFTILAGMSDDMGKIMLILMWGFVLGWCLIHTSELGTIVKAI